jgi:hypothetical protein
MTMIISKTKQNKNLHEKNISNHLIIKRNGLFKLDDNVESSPEDRPICIERTIGHVVRRFI